MGRPQNYTNLTISLNKDEREFIKNKCKEAHCTYKQLILMKLGYYRI